MTENLTRAVAPRLRTAAAALALVAVTGLAFGVLTAYAQGWLPVEVGSLANSAGAWTLLAFGLVLLTARPGTPGLAGLAGALALVTLLIGYVLGAGVRGYPSSSSLIVFWGAAAVVVGPVIGVAAAWNRFGSPPRVALGAGAVAGVLIGEGIYGLRYIADTTYPPYWWGSTVAGTLLLAVIAARRRLRRGIVALAIAVTVVVAAAFVMIYSANLIAALP